MGPGRDLGCDFLEMKLHHGRVATGQHEPGADTAGRADGTEYVAGLRPLITGRCRSRALTRPAARDLGLLADAGFILKPDL
jgi:hypothetical protein